MYHVNLKIASHQDAADFIEMTHNSLETHFYDSDHFSEVKHLATPEEGREYLDLLLEMTKTFPDNNPEFVRYNGACFLTVARLMAIAGVKLSEHDKQRILDYTTVEYDSDYLNYACQIRDAEVMLHCIADFWDQVATLESYYRKAADLSDQIGALPWFRLIKRFRLAYQFAQWVDETRIKANFISCDDIPRVCDSINSNYQSDLEYVYPLIFYHRPTQIAGNLFPDQQTEDEVRAEWENHDLYCKFGDAKLARLLDLLPGFSTDFFVYHPDTGELITRGTDRKQQVLTAYPELEPYYDAFLAIDATEDGDGYVSDDMLRFALHRIANIFDAEKYLDTANYSRRQKLPADHPEAHMTEQELSVANAILDFMENTK